MPDSDNCESVDDQLRDLRSSISDLGYQIDSFKAKTAAALGLGVFLLLLSTLAAYDSFNGRQAIWQTVGIGREALWWISVVGSCAALGLLVYGLFRVKRSDTNASARLEQMEQRYAELIEQKTHLQKTGEIG